MGLRLITSSSVAGIRTFRRYKGRHRVVTGRHILMPPLHRALVRDTTSGRIHGTKYGDCDMEVMGVKAVFYIMT